MPGETEYDRHAEVPRNFLLGGNPGNLGGPFRSKSESVRLREALPKRPRNAARVRLFRGVSEWMIRLRVG
jgi:hypothetical protein